ncbi:putative two-component response regulator ARR20 isoform X2 [Quercus robur]|nr:putative two-component response regulator ARR20 isoform X2 [Quercus robur]
MEGSVFHIIIIEKCLLGVNEFELLRIGREMDLPVIATSEDAQPNIVQWSLENGACDYLLKPIPMNVLKMVWKYMFFKKDNNVSRVKNQRLSWTPDSHEKFVESVRKLGGADDATPNKILQLLQSNFKGFEDVDREKISSHLQKYRDSL